MLTDKQIEELSNSFRENLLEMNKPEQYTEDFYENFGTVEKKLLENSQNLNADALSQLMSSLAKDHKKKTAHIVGENSNL